MERDVKIRILLDTSASMAHRDGELVKLDYARMLAAALAYLANRQGDRLAFHGVGAGGSVDLPGGRLRPLLRLLHLLDGLEPAGRWPSFTELQEHLAIGRIRELVLVISDLYDPDGEILTAIKRLRALGHELLVFHVMGRNELDFTYSGDLELEDLETGETVIVDAEAAREGYLARLRAGLDEWRDTFLELRVGYALMPMDTPLELSLRELLLARSALPR